MYVRHAAFCTYPSTSVENPLNVKFSAALVNATDEDPKRVSIRPCIYT